ncbi:MAG: SOS response-associated peptidase [Leptolyngbyaceae cyanobacterium bins.59]|nr:SOS response-associated peptidase [Leptolyngbyaceae cyanobacterium bins.59]
MCGRYTLSQSADVLAEAFHLPEVPLHIPRYNIAPTQGVAVIQQSQGTRQWQLLRWGLIPSWSKDVKIGNKLINARSETVAEKPSFRSAFRYRRCLIPADGFYEWQRQEKKKQPFYFQVHKGQPFAFAGLWEHWEGEGGPIDSCTLLTTQANALLAPIHDRMPVILHPEDYDRWLDPQIQDSKSLESLFQPYPSEEMAGYPVSAIVNSPAHDTLDCVVPQAK